MKRALAAAVLALAAPLAVADDAPSFKFTAGVYRFGGGGEAVDLNLRHTSDAGNVWIGWFRWPHERLAQARAGWDRTVDLGAVRVQPSLQLDSGGFAGGSLYAETGERWFAGAGIARTNLKTGFNLGFDPGDAWTVGGGHRWAAGHVLAFTLVGDNRRNPDQRHLHAQYRTPLDGHRLVVDVLFKRGLVDGARVRRAGFSVGYDWPRFFLRVAWDPKVNFTPQDMLRVQVGTRF